MRRVSRSVRQFAGGCSSRRVAVGEADTHPGATGVNTGANLRGRSRHRRGMRELRASFFQQSGSLYLWPYVQGIGCITPQQYYYIQGSSVILFYIYWTMEPDCLCALFYKFPLTTFVSLSFLFAFSCQRCTLKQYWLFLLKMTRFARVNFQTLWRKYTGPIDHSSRRYRTESPKWVILRRL